MLRIASCWKKFNADESGATSIEYALIAGIISIAIVAGLTSVKDDLSSTFTNVGSELNSNTAN